LRNKVCFRRCMEKLLRRTMNICAAPIAAYLAAVISNPKFRSAVIDIYDHFYGHKYYFDPLMRLAHEAEAESADFIKNHLARAVLFRKPFVRSFWNFALSKAPRDGLFCEFGVFNGSSINYFAAKRPEVTWHGFDSFEGLPGDWSQGNALPKGTFDLKGSGLPVVRENVELHQGWFDKSLPEFAERNAGKMSFMHIDCDLYLSTKIIFDVLGDRIQAGTIIVFDEFLNYPGWQEHEYKAFMEFCEARRVKYSFIAFNSYRAAVMIEAP